MTRPVTQRVGVEASKLEEQALIGCAALQESTARERAWGRNVKGRQIQEMKRDELALQTHSGEELRVGCSGGWK